MNETAIYKPTVTINRHGASVFILVIELSGVQFGLKLYA